MKKNTSISMPPSSPQSSILNPQSSSTIATWNVNSIKVRLPHILEWLEKNQPDILALQETKVIDENFPKNEIQKAGYRVIFSGQKSFNGMAIISRQTPVDMVTDIPELIDPQRRILAATINNIRVVNLYVPNGQSITSEKYQYKLTWLEKVKNYLVDQLKKYPKLIVLGDLNIAPQDIDVHDPVLWKDSILCSESERQAFQTLLNLGFRDAFRLFNQGNESFSWWDYRAGAFWRNQGLRIDHIMVSETLIKHCQSCMIDKSPRKLKQPSDHAPVVLQLVTTN